MPATDLLAQMQATRIHLALGRMLARRGRPDAARVEYHRASLLDPTNEIARALEGALADEAR